MSSRAQIFEFTLGTTVWRWTSAGLAQSFGGQTYQPLEGLGIGQVQRTGQAARADVQITMPASVEPAARFLPGLPDAVLTVVLRELVGGSWRAVFRGRVLGCEFGGVAATLTASPWFTALRTRGLRRQFGAQCPHRFCASACGLAAADWTVTGTVTAVDGTGVTLSVSHAPAALLDGGVLADGALDGGLLTVVRDGSPAAREVAANAGASLTLVRGFYGLSVGDEVQVLAGCDKTIETCQARGNIASHGGFPYVPQVNPLGGGSIL